MIWASVRVCVGECFNAAHENNQMIVKREHKI